MNVLPAATFGLIDGALPSASRISPQENALFWALFATCAVVVIGLTLTIGIFLVRYRQGSSAPRGPVRLATWKFETTWIAGTTLIFLGFFIWGARIYVRMNTIPTNAMTIDVIGRQWMWDMRHADGRRELAQLHVPVNQSIVLRLTSEDVIHSFAVPAFRLKQDAVPGKTVATWFEATQTGSFPIYCDQYCGTAHAEMGGQVVVQSAEDYATWLASGTSAMGAAGHGRELFVRYGCSGCHVGNSSVRAPRLEGLAGRTVPVENGQQLVVDDRYLRDSILLPNLHIAAGYAALMPSYQGVIPEGELLDLIAYLKSLGAETAPINPATAP